MGSWRDGVDGERQRDRETKEAETGDVTTAAAESNFHHKGSADKQKFNSVGYQAREKGHHSLLRPTHDSLGALYNQNCKLLLQRRTKQKVVTDFATVSKGTSVGAKPRAALRQVLFNQGVSDKNPAPEVLSCLSLYADTDLFNVATTHFNNHSPAFCLRRLV